MQLTIGRPGFLALFTQVTLLDPLNKLHQRELTSSQEWLLQIQE